MSSGGSSSPTWTGWLWPVRDTRARSSSAGFHPWTARSRPPTTSRRSRPRRRRSSTPFRTHRRADHARALSVTCWQMSFVHYLTVGRFGFTERSVPPNLMERVVAHFVPDGLRQLGGETSFIVPWDEGELRELEEAVMFRYGLELNLSDYRTPDGLLSIQYTGVETHVAFPVARVAGELFGASAGERGQLYDAAYVEKAAERDASENKERKRVAAIPNGQQRLQAVVDALHAGAQFLPPWLAERLLAPVAPFIIDQLVALLGSDEP